MSKSRLPKVAFWPTGPVEIFIFFWEAGIDVMRLSLPSQYSPCSPSRCAILLEETTSVTLTTAFIRPMAEA